MKRSALVAVLAVSLSLTALAGQFLIKTEHLLLYRGGEESVLVIHNPGEKIVDKIEISFPATVHVTELTTYDGVLELTSRGKTVILTGALLASGFVQLRWQPGLVLPSSAVLTSGEKKWTFGFPGQATAKPAEIYRFPAGKLAAALIGRSETEAEQLTIAFSSAVKELKTLGIGVSPKIVKTGGELVLKGPFPPGSGVLVEWTPPDVKLVQARWNDRDAFQGELALPGFTARGNGPVGYEFRALPAAGKAFLWDFGDGTTATGRYAHHVYKTPGSYLVTLVVKDSTGKELVFQNWIKVVNVKQGGPAGKMLATNLPPIADPGGPYGPYNWSEDWSSDQPVFYLDVAFDASGSTDVDGRIVSYVWNFGDGTTLTTSQPYVVHRYQVTGEEKPAWLPGDPVSEEGEELLRIPVTLTVIDDQGNKTTATTYVETYPLWYWEGEVY